MLGEVRRPAPGLDGRGAVEQRRLIAPAVPPVAIVAREHLQIGAVGEALDIVVDLVDYDVDEAKLA